MSAMLTQYVFVSLNRDIFFSLFKMRYDITLLRVISIAQCFNTGLISRCSIFYFLVENVDCDSTSAELEAFSL